jgi:GNAT superfamily N-acetyltransferase
LPRAHADHDTGTVRVVSVADRPDLVAELQGFDDSWPRFMLEDPVAALMEPMGQRYPQLQLLLLDEESRCVGKAHAVGFEWDGTVESLPDRGWDGVLLRSARSGKATAVSALEIAVRPGLRGRGLSAVLLEALRDAVAGMGLTDLFAPVRPNQKSAEPLASMEEYAFRVREDGLPVDPWLRVHVRAGARIVRVCPLSMTITGTLPDWRRWTGLPFDTSGEVTVDGALAPVAVSVPRNLAVYIEPNVWVHHRVAPAPT